MKTFVVALAATAAVLGGIGTSPTADQPTGATGSTGAASSASAASTHYGFLSRQVNAKAPVARWNPCAAIGYRVSSVGGGAGATADVIEAAKRIRAATGLPLVYRGQTSVVPGKGTAAYPKDTQIVVAWSKPGLTRFLPKPSKGTYAVAGYGGGSWTTGWDAQGRQWGRFLQGYVVLNSGYHFAHGFGAGPATGWQGTRGQLVMHELGHAVGLDHTTDRNQIMYPTMTRKAAVFGAGDRTGLHYLGRSSGCLYATKR
ncbi:matrixin family metalloprotease [Angustibacter luteus]|uniref:Matrixin family metalloprotease n=1 Tax=Angustibacter luteus TaxID=658456 RepID=A0ABW1JED0_9ACTN